MHTIIYYDILCFEVESKYYNISIEPYKKTPDTSYHDVKT